MKGLFELLKKKILKHQWIIVFLLSLPFVNDSYPTHYYVYSLMKDCFKFVSFLVVLFLFVKKGEKISRLFAVVSAFEVCLLLSTIANQSEVIVDCIYDVLGVVFFGLLTQTFLEKSENLVDGVMLNYEVALYPCLLNNLLGITKEGYYPKGLLNTLVLWILPALMLASIKIFVQKRYIRASILIVSCLILVYQVRSTTLTLCVLGTIGLLVLCYLMNRFANLSLSIWLPLALIFLASIFFVFFYSGGQNGFVDFLIEKVLRKTTTFTQRDVIWKEAIRMIKEKPIFGHGYMPLIYAENDFGKVFIHAHNQLLQKANECGIIGLVLFFLIHLELGRKIDKIKDAVSKMIAVSFVCGVCITYITEAYKDFYLFYMIFFIAYNIDVLSNGLRDRFQGVVNE